MSAAVVAHGGADLFGNFVEMGDQLLDRFVAQAGPFDRLVQIGDISRVMLIVMDFHRLLVDVRLQGVVGIR